MANTPKNLTCAFGKERTPAEYADRARWAETVKPGRRKS